MHIVLHIHIEAPRFVNRINAFAIYKPEPKSGDGKCTNRENAVRSGTFCLTLPRKTVTHLLHTLEQEGRLQEHFELMGGKLHLYRRENSRNWQCSTFLAGRNWRQSTREDGFGHAKAIAEDWYLGLKGKMRDGELKVGKTFKEAAKKFMPEYQALTFGERSPKYVEGLDITLKAHLLPFFHNRRLSEITPGLVQEYRIHRMTSRKDKKTGEPKRPARSTLQQEIVVLRHVLKTANRHGWLPYLPNLCAPYKMSGKIGHRAWFSPEEYKRLYEATRAGPSSQTIHAGRTLAKICTTTYFSWPTPA